MINIFTWGQFKQQLHKSNELPENHYLKASQS